MCGRFIQSFNNQELKSYLKNKFNLETNQTFFLPNYNVSPGNDLIAIIYDGSKYRVGNLNWGFIPSFAKKDRPLKIINSRSESIFEKPSFKNSIRKKRCIILANGFYEWDKNKKPYLFTLENKKIFGFAAIYETFINNNEKIHTTSLLTINANDLISDVHERMPIILNEDEIFSWLNPVNQEDNLIKNHFKQYNSNLMTKVRVSTLVNKTSYNDISLITPIN